MKAKNTLPLMKQVKYSKLPLEHFKNGNHKENYNASELKVDIDVLSSLNYQKKKEMNTIHENLSATVESPPLPKKKIWKDKLSTSQINSLITKLLKISVQDSIGKEKDCLPLSIPHSLEISKQLWLPTEIGSVDSVLSSSRESSKNAPMGRSWFSINNILPQKKNSLMTSFQLSMFSLPDSMDSVPIPSKHKSNNKQLKTLKIRLFPTPQEKKQIETILEQQRWYYNAAVAITQKHFGDKLSEPLSYSDIYIRDKVMKKYSYDEELYESKDGYANLIFKDFSYHEDRNEFPRPQWWDSVHSRTPRGAIKKYVSSLNSCLTNYKRGHIRSFNMKFKSKRDIIQSANFEDKGYPSFLNKIKSQYWYKNKKGKRARISFSEICGDRGLEVIHEKDTDKYYIHYPVESNWYPEEDIRNESQVKYSSKGDRIISLDPGIRKFLVGYDPTGRCTLFGESCCRVLTRYLYDVDKRPSSKKWRRIKNMVSELHWKTISYLIENYDYIILPDFRVSQMIRGKKLGRMTKRLMCMFSFYSFKEKLKNKCSVYGKKLFIVDESYTSCTCTNCFVINKIGSNEVYRCVECGYENDRDVCGSRNILIKNLRLG